MKTSEVWMNRGSMMMNGAQTIEKCAGPLQVAVCNNRGWSTTDAMGFSGLCQYAIGKVISWFGY